MQSVRQVVAVATAVATVWILPSLVRGAEDRAPASGKDLPQQVRKLLRDLDADERAVRVNAERELLDLGPEILPLLPAPELLKSAGVRGAVAQIRITLERRKARESVLPSRVTLEGKLPLKQVLQGISQQTGNSLDANTLSAAE